MFVEVFLEELSKLDVLRYHGPAETGDGLCSFSYVRNGFYAFLFENRKDIAHEVGNLTVYYPDYGLVFKNLKVSVPVGFFALFKILLPYLHVLHHVRLYHAGRQ